MVRVFAVKESMNQQALQDALLDARFRGPQAEAAMERLKAFNPHLDFKKMRAGTVVLVPDAPGLKASAADQKSVTPVAGFAVIARKGLGEAEKDMKRANAARAAERADLTAVFKSAPFKRALEQDGELAQQAAAVAKLLSADEARDKADERALAKLTKSAAAALDKLVKLAEG